ncbi:IS5/IS1182 family transposase, partial [Diaphorobacter sp. NR2-3-3-1]|nr:IS5/IS1182 family transposase [Diaphorobacter caeni]
MLHSLMSRAPISKELWQQLQPLIPPFIASRKGGRHRTISDEAAFNG